MKKIEFEERMVDKVRDKILNNPYGDIKSLEFTEEEYKAMKEEVKSNEDVSLTAETNEEVLELFIKITIYQAITDGKEFFYFDTGMESYIYDWAKALHQLYN